MKKITMRNLLTAGVHFGHRTRFWNPKMAPYIYGSNNKIHVVNLEHTLSALYTAQEKIKAITSKGGKILFVGTKHAASASLKAAAIASGQPFVAHRWLGGTLTNYKTIRSLITSLADLEAQKEDGTFNKMIKKEALMFERKRVKLELNVGGIKDMGGLPDAIFVIDVKYERIAIREARTLGIPVIAVVDTNSSPDSIDCIIPGNDDATRAIKLYVDAIADACIAGNAVFKPESDPNKPHITIKAKQAESAPQTDKESTAAAVSEQ
jgi:small subunit ribosomal protein S2